MPPAHPWSDTFEETKLTFFSYLTSWLQNYLGTSDYLVLSLPAKAWMFWFDVFLLVTRCLVKKAVVVVRNAIAATNLGYIGVKHYVR